MVARSTGGTRFALSAPRWIASLTLTAVATLAFVGCGPFGDDGDDDAALLGESSDGTAQAQAADGAAVADAGDDAPLLVTTGPDGTESTADSITGSSAASNPTSTSTSSGSTSITSLASTSASNPESTSTTTSATSSSSSTAPTSTQTTTTTTTTTSSPSTPTTSNSGGGDCRPTATICAGPGRQITTLAAAVAAASDGAVIELIVGRYNETVAVAANGVTIRSAPGGRAVIDCTGIQPAQGKACVLAVGTDLTVEDVEVTGARGPDNNEACFRNEPGTRFTVRRVECHGSNNGILGSGGSWLIEDSHFYDNGAGDGFSHNLYLSGDCSEVIFRRSTSERARGGHAFKSRCRTSTIEGSTLTDNTVGDAAEFSYGGTVTISNTVIHQPDGSNGNIVRHGAEGCRHGGALTFISATVTSDRSQGYIRSACGAVGLESTQLPAGITVTEP